MRFKLETIRTEWVTSETSKREMCMYPQGLTYSIYKRTNSYAKGFKLWIKDRGQ